MSTRATKAATGRGAVDSSSSSPSKDEEKPSPSRREHQRDKEAEEEETDDKSNTGNESPQAPNDDEERDDDDRTGSKETEEDEDDGEEADEEEDEDGSPSATGPASMGKSSHGGGSGGDVSAGRWTAREHDIFLRGLRDYGREWKKISQMIKSRTVVQIRTHAQKYFQKLARDGVEGADLGLSSSSTTATTNKSLSSSSSGIHHRTPESEGKTSKKRHHDSRGYNKSSSSSSSSAAAGNPSTLSQVSPAAAYNGNGGYESKRLHIEPSKPSSSSSSEGMWSPSGITPRTVAAATILVAPRVSPDSAWFARRQAMAMELLSQPRRTSPRLSNISTPPTWNGAAALHRVVLPQQYPSPSHTPPPVSHHSM